jgi:hypothetical protein
VSVSLRLALVPRIVPTDGSLPAHKPSGLTASCTIRTKGRYPRLHCSRLLRGGPHISLRVCQLLLDLHSSPYSSDSLLHLHWRDRSGLSPNILLTGDANSTYNMHFVVNALALLVALPPALATCYYPNGTSVSEWSPTFSAQPCSNDTNSPLAHVCCSVNRPNPSGGSFEDGFTADKCLPNGLCQNVGKDEEGTMLYSYWRDFCTDAEWSAGKCLKNVCTGTGVSSSSICTAQNFEASPY